MIPNTRYRRRTPREGAFTLQRSRSLHKSQGQSCETCNLQRHVTASRTRNTTDLRDKIHDLLSYAVVCLHPTRESIFIIPELYQIRFSCTCRSSQGYTFGFGRPRPHWRALTACLSGSAMLNFGFRHLWR